MIGRCAGTVSSSGAVERASAPGGSASSGSSRSTGSSSRSLHSSTRIIAATAVIGLVIEAMRKIVSRRIGVAGLDGQRADRLDVHLAAPADQRDEAGHLAALDVAGHHVVHAAEPCGARSRLIRTWLWSPIRAPPVSFAGGRRWLPPLCVPFSSRAPVSGEGRGTCRVARVSPDRSSSVTVPLSHRGRTPSLETVADGCRRSVSHAVRRVTECGAREIANRRS